MRALAVWLVGLLLGVAAGAAVLYFNPLTGLDGSLGGVGGERIQLRYATAGSGALALTHSAPLEQIEPHPPGTPRLWESALLQTALGVFVMTDETGTATALASRISKLSPRTNPVTQGILLADEWLVTVPGDGTYVIESDSNLWPLLRDTVVDVGLLDRPWSEPREYRVTVGPDFSGGAVVTGATGIFRDMTGTAVDTLRIDGIARLADLAEPIEGVLEVSLNVASTGESDDALNVARETP